MKRSERCDKDGRNPFQIASELADGNIAWQELLVITFERTQEITHIGPQAFRSAAMDFANPVALVIARVLPGAMRDGGMETG